MYFDGHLLRSSLRVNFIHFGKMSENFVTPLDNTTYVRSLPFERIDYTWWRLWMRDNWSLSVYCTILYVSVILFGRKWMAARKPYNGVVRKTLLVWNIFLALFSILAFARCLPELNELLLRTPKGFHISICSREKLTITSLYWQLLGTLSKILEMGDTIFIVLRKQPLIFLHWYHHSTVALYTWYSFDAQDPVHRWFATLNFGIHGVMYSYYALKSLGVKLPKEISMFITTSQIAQMFMGIFVNVYSLFYIVNGWDCQRRKKNVLLALGMYLSYFILFANFFVQTYLKRRSRKDANENKNMEAKKID